MTLRALGIDVKYDSVKLYAWCNLSNGAFNEMEKGTLISFAKQYIALTINAQQPGDFDLGQFSVQLNLFHSSFWKLVLETVRR